MLHYKKPLIVVGMVALLFLLVACSVPGSATSPAQTLASSATAMSKLSSVHFDLQTTVAVTGGSSAKGLTYTVTGQGDAAAPDKVSLKLSSGGPLLSLISSGSKVYVQIAGGTWHAVSKDQIKDAEQNQLTDHGQETLNGESLDHITATLDAQTLQTLSSELNQLAPSSAQSGQNQLKKATLDVWIDASTSYVHVAQLDIVTQVDASALEHFSGHKTGASGVLPIELKAHVTFSKFNQPVTIQPPV